MKIIMMTLLCYISQLYFILAAVKVQRRQLDFGEQEIIFGHESFIKGKLTYAICTNNDTTSEKTCQVIREKSPLSNDTFSCNITLKVIAKKNNGTKFADNYGLVPFGKDKAVFYVVQRKKRVRSRLNTIQFDGCKVTETNITLLYLAHSKDHIVIVPYSNSYDVVYPSAYTGFLKTTIKSDGERFPRPIILGSDMYLAHFPYILPVSYRSRNRGFVYMTFDMIIPGDFDLHVMKPNGSDIVLGTHQFKLRSMKAVNDDLIGICHDFDNRHNYVRCTQYDVNGTLLFEADMNGHKNETIAFIHNIPDGGMYLFGAKPIIEMDSIEFFLAKLDPLRKSYGYMSLGELQFKAEALAVTFYKSDDSEHCMSVVDYNAFGMNNENLSNPYYIHQTVHCFSDSDFFT